MAWSTLSTIVNGKRDPSLSNVEAVAQALETTVAYLIGETDNSESGIDADRIIPEVRNWSWRLLTLTDEGRGAGRLRLSRTFWLWQG